MDADMMTWHVIAEIVSGDGAGKAYEYWINGYPAAGDPLAQVQQRMADQGLVAGREYRYHSQVVATFRCTWQLPREDIKTLPDFQRDWAKAHDDWERRKRERQAHGEGGE